MPRTVNAANLAAAQSDSGYQLICFVELDFAGNPVYANTSGRSYTISGYTYVGVGLFGAISGIEESTENQTYSATVQLSGADPSMLGLVTSLAYKGRRAVISLGFADATGTLVANPDVVFAGRMDTMAIEIGDKATIQITIADPRATWETPRLRRYTDLDQQAHWPGDLGCEFVTGLQDRQIIWGASGAT